MIISSYRHVRTSQTFRCTHNKFVARILSADVSIFSCKSRLEALKPPWAGVILGAEKSSFWKYFENFIDGKHQGRMLLRSGRMLLALEYMFKTYLRYIPYDKTLGADQNQFLWCILSADASKFSSKSRLEALKQAAKGPEMISSHNLAPDPHYIRKWFSAGYT